MERKKGGGERVAAKMKLLVLGLLALVPVQAEEVRRQILTLVVKKTFLPIHYIAIEQALCDFLFKLFDKISATS